MTPEEQAAFMADSHSDALQAAEDESRPPTETHHPPHPTDAYIVAHKGKVDHVCEDCGQKSAVLIREPKNEGGHLTAACDECGYGGGSGMVHALIGADPLAHRVETFGPDSGFTGRRESP
jgi:predicted RNA-binding Zn-ribbon protein involved in translation (DUF1610 family)